jgi:hypothetical protein
MAGVSEELPQGTGDSSTTSYPGVSHSGTHPSSAKAAGGGPPPPPTPPFIFIFIYQRNANPCTLGDEHSVTHASHILTLRL